MAATLPNKSFEANGLRKQITEYGVDGMADTTGKRKIEKTSRGMRKHMRRVKQESRKAGTPISEWKKKVRVQPLAKKKGA
jgi:hypothetical protein